MASCDAMRLKDKIVIVTGGGSGIGEAIAERFAREGAAVVVAGRRANRLKAVAEAIETAGGRASWVVTDVREAADCRRLIEATLAEFGRLDILVTSAGVLPVRLPLGDVPDEAWEATIATNVTGLFHCCKAAIRALCETKGTIVNIASVAGLKGVPSSAPYSISKAAAIQLTRSMAIDYASSGVRVNAVCPAVVETDLNRDMLAARKAAGTYDALVMRHPLARFGTLDDVVEAALFLASDAAGWITGVALPVDGGVAAGEPAPTNPSDSGRVRS
jgi:meso-butanediol dehydrogenase / (S,S)-butanediol dehydrogenase / diacetyl reductase